MPAVRHCVFVKFRNDVPAAERDAIHADLEALRDGTRAAIAAGLGIAEAPARVASAEARSWRLAENYHGRNVSTAYRELEWE